MVLIVRLNRVISGSISLAIKTFLLKSPIATAVTMAPISRSAFWKARLAVKCQPQRCLFKTIEHTLLMLAEFPFQCADVLNAMFEYHALCR